MAGQHSLRRTAASLLQPANLRPFLIVMALFLFYPITGMEALNNGKEVPRLDLTSSTTPGQLHYRRPRLDSKYNQLE